MRVLGAEVPRPPSAEASRMENLRTLWSGAGLQSIETREIVVRRSFADFDDFWTTCSLSPGLRLTLAAMSPADIETLKARVRAKLKPDGAGRITYASRANAIKGRVPK